MDSDQYYIEKNLTLPDLLDKNENLTYLIGAGVSMNAPSNLPSARTISKALLEYIIPPKYLDTVAAHEGLRYEDIIEQIKNFYDDKLGFMEYFNNCRTSNLIHFFLAHAVIQKSGMITTNFDYLIEWALHNSLDELTRSKIKLIITPADFKGIPNILGDISNGYFPIFKIHGSFQNVATKEMTVDSLITTTSALSREKGEGEILGLEPYKKSAIEPLLKDRVLIVMGYSGNDDFDIGPFLKAVKGIKHLIWIDHIPKSQFASSNPTLQTLHVKQFLKLDDSFKMENLLRNPDISKVDKVLSDIRTHNQFEIYKLEINTLQFVQDYLFPFLLPKIDIHRLPIEKTSPPIPEFKTWIAPLFKNTAESKKSYIALIILNRLGEYSQAIDVGLTFLKQLETTPDKSKELTTLLALGVLYDNLNTPEKALEYSHKAKDLASKLGDEESLGTILNNLGAFYTDQQQNDQALQYYSESLKIGEKLSNWHLLATTKLNMAKIYNGKSDYSQASQFIQDAMTLFDKCHDLRGKGECLKTLAALYMNLKDFDKGIKSCEDALIVARSLGDTASIAFLENKLGMLFVKKVNARMALVHFKQAIVSFDEIHNTKEIYDPLYNLGMILVISKFYNEAIQFLSRAYTFALNSQDHEKIANSSFGLAKAAKALGFNPEALKYAQIAHEQYMIINRSTMIKDVEQFLESFRPQN
jgi:tetratricopeptide (TPR) repeat protein/NAD-dependent SIR2 family protein deacetylase